MSDPFELGTFSGVVPLFPLPNVILFPRTVLPLHIFEPRYREMTARALEGERLLAMGLLRTGWEQDYYGNPPVHEVVGLGRITEEKRLEDGRYHIVLYGVSRARIQSVVSTAPYRTVQVSLLTDEEDPARPEERERLRRHFLTIYQTSMAKAFGQGALASDPHLSLGALCDIVTALLPLPVEKRQLVLETPDVEKRAELVQQFLLEGGAVAPSQSSPFDPNLN